MAFGDNVIEGRLALLGELAPVTPDLLFLVAIALLLTNLCLRGRLEWAADAAAVEYAGACRPPITALKRRIEEGSVPVLLARRSWSA